MVPECDRGGTPSEVRARGVEARLIGGEGKGIKGGVGSGDGEWVWGRARGWVGGGPEWVERPVTRRKGVGCQQLT